MPDPTKIDMSKERDNHGELLQQSKNQPQPQGDENWYTADPGRVRQPDQLAFDQDKTSPPAHQDPSQFSEFVDYDSSETPSDSPPTRVYHDEVFESLRGLVFPATKADLLRELEGRERMRLRDGHEFDLKECVETFDRNYFHDKNELLELIESVVNRDCA